MFKGPNTTAEFRLDPVFPVSWFIVNVTEKGEGDGKNTGFQEIEAHGL